jgi:hypothetical protein
MTTTDQTQLIEIYAQVEALFWMATGHPCNTWPGWSAAYQADGLQFGKSRGAVESLRRLVEAGLLSARGSTQGRTFQLTTAGVFTGFALTGHRPEEAAGWLEHIRDLEKKSATTLPGTDNTLVMGYDLMDTAGAWWKKANKTRKTWKAYQDELSLLNRILTPLLILNWLTKYADQDGRLWAVAITPQGRQALNEWPALQDLPDDDPECDAAFEQGFDSGISLYTRTPPTRFKNVVERYLPATDWRGGGL